MLITLDSAILEKLIPSAYQQANLLRKRLKRLEKEYKQDTEEYHRIWAEMECIERAAGMAEMAIRKGIIFCEMATKKR